MIAAIDLHKLLSLPIWLSMPVLGLLVLSFVFLIAIPIWIVGRHELKSFLPHRSAIGSEYKHNSSIGIPDKSASASLRLAARLDIAAIALGKISMSLVLVLILTEFAVVILRYVFSIGSIALQESVIYAHATIFMLGAGYTLVRDQHVRIDIFYVKLDRRGKAWINLLGALLLLLPFSVIVAWTGFDFVTRSWVISEKSIEVSGLHYIYLLKSLILIFAMTLLMQAISRSLHALTVLNSPRSRKT